jgi:hypothetical protein
LARTKDFAIGKRLSNPILQVLYLDNLDFGTLNKDHQLRPRYKDYSSDVVKNLVAEDRVENCSTVIAEFGRTKVLILYNLCIAV